MFNAIIVKTININRTAGTQIKKVYSDEIDLLIKKYNKHKLIESDYNIYITHTGADLDIVNTEATNICEFDIKGEVILFKLNKNKEYINMKFNDLVSYNIYNQPIQSIQHNNGTFHKINNSLCITPNNTPNNINKIIKLSSDDINSDFDLSNFNQTTEPNNYKHMDTEYVEHRHNNSIDNGIQNNKYFFNLEPNSISFNINNKYTEEIEKFYGYNNSIVSNKK